MLLAGLDRLIKIRFPVGKVDPLAALRRSTCKLKDLRPTLRLAGPTQALSASFCDRRRPGDHTALTEKSYHRPFRSLFQVPAFHPHRQGAVQFKASSLAVSDWPQVLGHRML